MGNNNYLNRKEKDRKKFETLFNTIHFLIILTAFVYICIVNPEERWIGVLIIVLGVMINSILFLLYVNGENGK